MTLSDLIRDHGIQHFTPEVDHRILSPVVKGGRGIIEPPEEYWPRILPTLEALDEMRERMGMALRLVSGYRTPVYNALVGGVPDGEHEQFRAGDVAAADHALLCIIATQVMDDLHASGLRTGLGIYRTFVHIDVGSTRRRIWRWDWRTAK